MTSADGAGLHAGGPRGLLAPYAEIFGIPRAWRATLTRTSDVQEERAI